METIELLAKFADPEVMKTLSVMERLMAGLITTVLGMGITFLSLIILQLVITLTARLTSGKNTKKVEEAAAAVSIPEIERNAAENDEELVAALSVALALQLNTSVSNIVIRNIEKIETSSSAWHRAGIAEQMHNSL
ncbi:MAG: OadG family protein [Desulfopila sp.]|jgi:sodium pump decarboxylase gamma subunit|nr:OadG family protein [Desulfopila sp.]